MKCKDCGKEMLNHRTKSCNKRLVGYISIGGEIYKRDTEYYDLGERCHDCGIENKRGNLHHFLCDVERCPRCDGQLLSCDCEKESIGSLKPKRKKVKMR